VTEVVGEPVDSSFLPDAPAEPKAEEPAPPPKRRAPAAPKADAAKPKAKRAPKPKAEKEAERVAASEKALDEHPGSPRNLPADDLAAEKAIIADRYKNLTADAPASERHEAVKVLAKTGKFSYVEIAKITHYANGGVVRNIVIPPVRKGRPDPLEGDTLAQVRALETALGMTVQEIAKRTPKVEA